MKLRVHSPCLTALSCSVVLLCLPLVSSGDPAKTNASSKSPDAPAATPEAPAGKPEVPQSVFVVPTIPGEGKDPFFPRSSRPYQADTPVQTTKSNLPPVAIELVLQGISGTREQPLAIINNQTFAVGEENDVVAGKRRVRIRCLEINPQTEAVLVQVGSERRELRLPRK